MKTRTYTYFRRCTRLPPDFHTKYEVKVENQSIPMESQEIAEDLTQNPYYGGNLPEDTNGASDLTQNPYYEQSQPRENVIIESNLTKNLYYE